MSAAMRATCGSMSLRTCRRRRSAPCRMAPKPVRLRVPRTMAAGSPTAAITTGMVAVAALAASAAGVPRVTIRSTSRRANSAASAGKLSLWPSAERYSKLRFCALDIAERAQRLLQHLEIGVELRRARVQDADPVAPGAGGLRPRRQRPGRQPQCRRAGERHDEVSTFHSAPPVQFAPSSNAAAASRMRMIAHVGRPRHHGLLEPGPVARIKRPRRLLVARLVPGQRRHETIRRLLRQPPPVRARMAHAGGVHQLAQRDRSAARLRGEPVPMPRQERDLARHHAQLRPSRPARGLGRCSGVSSGANRARTSCGVPRRSKSTGAPLTSSNTRSG